MRLPTLTPAPIRALASLLALAPMVASAQERTQPTQTRTQAPAPVMESQEASAREARQRALGETYRRSGDEEQDPAELARTRDLNAQIAARNEAAARSDAQAQAAFQAAQAQYRADVAAQQAEQARIDAQTAENQALYAGQRAEWERRMALYEAEVRACEAAGGQNCRSGGVK